MGGKNAQIVMDDADLSLALEGALWGGFGTTGQRCTATSRIIVHKKVYAKFAAEFAKLAGKLKVGNGLDESVDVGPTISESQLHTVEEYVKIGKNEDHATLLCGGHRLTKGDLKYGFFHEPTIFGDVSPRCALPRKKSSGRWCP